MAAFGSLSDRLNDTFDRLRGKGKLTEADINAAMREIRMALLEADVNYRVVKDFVTRTKERCLASEVMESLTPAQNVVKIVLDELTELLGGTESKLVLSSRIPNVIMLVGLQGSGKTTAAVKLAYMLKKQGKSPLLAACDVYQSRRRRSARHPRRRDRRAGVPRRWRASGRYRPRIHPRGSRQHARRGHRRHRRSFADR